MKKPIVKDKRTWLDERVLRDVRGGDGTTSTKTDRRKQSLYFPDDSL